MSYLFSERLISVVSTVPNVKHSNTSEGKLAILHGYVDDELPSKGSLVVRKGDDGGAETFNLSHDFYIFADAGPKGVLISPYETRVRWFFLIDEPKDVTPALNDVIFAASRGEHRVYGWRPPAELDAPDEVMFEDGYEWEDNREWYLGRHLGGHLERHHAKK